MKNVFRGRLLRAAALLLALILVPVLSGAETVVTSFYPVWLLARNLAAGLEGVEIRNMAAPSAGCLHDYQLQTADMKALASADVFLISGAGMESFLPQIASAFPELPIVEAAEGVPLLSEDGALQVGDAEEGANAHIWLDPTRAILMAENLAAGLSRVMPDRAEAVSANLEALTLRLRALDEQLREGLSSLPRKDIVTFHEAFPYFAQAYGLRVAAVVNKEPGETLTPAQTASLIAVLRDLGNPPLFVEPQYDDLSARMLSAETGAPVFTLDPVVTGPEDPPMDYYETVMLQNMTALQTALGE